MDNAVIRDPAMISKWMTVFNCKIFKWLIIWFNHF